MPEQAQMSSFVETNANVAHPSKMRGLILAGLVMTGVVSMQACADDGSERVDAESTTTTTTMISQDEFAIPGGFADGADEAVRADNNRGMFECGPKEEGVAADGSYNPDTYINYMSGNPDLASALNDLNKQDMGEKAYNFLIDNAASNPNATATIDGNEQYSDLSRKLIATKDVPEGTQALNYECIDGIDPYDVRTLHNGRTTLLGAVLTQEDYHEWTQLVQEAGEDPSFFIAFEVNADTNGDGSEESLMYITLMNAICKNPFRAAPPELLPPGVVQPPQVSRPRPTTPVTSPSTSIPRVTTTIPDKVPEQTPGPGEPGTTQPAPEGPPDVPPTTHKTVPPTTGTTIEVTVPSTSPPTVTIPQPKG